ncbi:MAG TPA: YqeG family HAD IIIA-type phosphatase [Clostridiaceae bacterium]|jgi:HAD superfamily phosphatase (TIGR01668 family)|nr:YqeG family HAD IIIA-type phosphatase [Clostridiaceae bacterium]
MHRFFPDVYVDRVQDINLNDLIKKNIKGLILDIDNTLVPPRTKEADENAVKWLEKVKEAGIKACIVSNATKKRVVMFNEELKLPAIYRALKPRRKAFIKAAALMDIDIKEAAVVGDQIFTDIIGGKKLKMYTILVKPFDNREFFFVKLKRFPERFILSRYKKYKNNKEK